MLAMRVSSWRALRSNGIVATVCEQPCPGLQTTRQFACEPIGGADHLDSRFMGSGDCIIDTAADAGSPGDFSKRRTGRMLRADPARGASGRKTRKDAEGRDDRLPEAPRVAPRCARRNTYLLKSGIHF